MITIQNEAIEVMRGLPDDRLEHVARAILDYGAHHNDEERF